MSDSDITNSRSTPDNTELSHGIWWIDDEANWRYVDARSDLPSLRDPAASDPEALSFLYSWLGMIRIDVRPTETIVEWDVQNVQPVSLAEAKTFLGRQQESRHIVLHYCYGGWCRERFCGAMPAFKRLLETEAYRHVIPFEGPTIHPIDLQRLDRGQLQQPLRQALQIWDGWKATPEQNFLTFLETSLLLERTVIYSRNETGELVYARIGRASLFAEAYGYQQTSGLIGQNCALDPDHPTSQNPICEAYEVVLASGHPRYDRLRVLYTRNETRHWISCERLLLPFTSPRGKDFLISICCPLETAAIPTLEGGDAIDPDASQTRTA